MTWCFALGPYLWLPMSAKVGSPGEPRGSHRPSPVIPGPAWQTHGRIPPPAGRMNSDRHGRGGMRTWPRSLLKSNRSLPGGLSSRATFSAFRRSEPRPGKCRRRGRLRRGQRRAHTASFISPSYVVKDVKSGEGVRKAARQADLNALPL